VSADRAHVGTAAASAGTTVFSGDRLDTEQLGTLQIRTGAARLVLGEASRLTWGTDGDAPAATLTRGVAAFSTANARAFTLRAGKAVFRPRSDEATVGNVTLLNARELVVRCSRGALTIAVDDDIRVISEGTAYRVVLDPTPAERAAASPAAGTTSWGQKDPRPPGKSNFIWYAIAFTTLVTGFVLREALESPDRP
jgi:hypothetical protein